MRHKVKVENGKYEFVQREGYAIDILRGGEPWVYDINASKAIGAMMAELDAARVVLGVVRQLTADWRSGAQVRLEDALKTHASLVDDREPPSTWATIRGVDPDDLATR